MVKLPSKEDLLGDKLTAFAPHTTGIPFFKGKKNCSMEICKQLFDVASLFDIVGDLSVTAKTFNKFAMVELQYRGENPDAIQKVLDDIYDTAKCIVMHGQDSQEEFDLIQDGIKKCVALFIVKSILWKVLLQMLQRQRILPNLSVKV